MPNNLLTDKENTWNNVVLSTSVKNTMDRIRELQGNLYLKSETDELSEAYNKERRPRELNTNILKAKKAGENNKLPT